MDLARLSMTKRPFMELLRRNSRSNRSYSSAVAGRMGGCGILNGADDPGRARPARRFKRFQEKWEPVFRRKRGQKETEAFSGKAGPSTSSR
jgi:hypothetical protein